MKEGRLSMAGLDHPHNFDIHGGGLDLQFPHHENEIAQSCCAHPESGFANVWMHNEMLQVEGKKMSKSLGNFFTVRDLLDQGYPGEVIRMVYLGTHYSKPMDWTKEKAEQAEATLRKWRGLVAGIEPAPSPLPGVVAALADDLNTAGALAELHGAASAGDYAGLKASASLLGLLEDGMGLWLDERDFLEWLIQGEDVRPRIAAFVQKIADARRDKDYQTADSLKVVLSETGITVSFDRDGGFTYKRTSDFDPAKLEALK